MNAMAERDREICSAILRNLANVAELCEQLADGYSTAGDQENGDYLFQAARRYRQAATAAPGAWAAADRLLTLRAAAAVDPETAACAARDTEEMPRVH